MLEKSRSLLETGLSFQRQDLRQRSGRFDLIFSHAALQWLEEHESPLPTGKVLPSSTSGCRCTRTSSPRARRCWSG